MGAYAAPVGNYGWCGGGDLNPLCLSALAPQAVLQCITGYRGVSFHEVASGVCIPECHHSSQNSYILVTVAARCRSAMSAFAWAMSSRSTIEYRRSVLSVLCPLIFSR